MHTFDKLYINFSSICCFSCLISCCEIFGNGNRNSLEAIERNIRQFSLATDRIKCPENNSFVTEQSFKRQIHINSLFNKTNK